MLQKELRAVHGYKRRRSIRRRITEKREKGGRFHDDDTRRLRCSARGLARARNDSLHPFKSGFWEREASRALTAIA